MGSFVLAARPKLRDWHHATSSAVFRGRGFWLPRTTATVGGAVGLPRLSPPQQRRVAGQRRLRTRPSGTGGRHISDASATPWKPPPPSAAVPDRLASCFAAGRPADRQRVPHFSRSWGFCQGHYGPGGYGNGTGAGCSEATDRSLARIEGPRRSKAREARASTSSSLRPVAAAILLFDFP